MNIKIIVGSRIGDAEKQNDSILIIVNLLVGRVSDY